MTYDSDIQYLKHHQIERDKYDECIINASNSLIYARSFYLDNICAKWDALIGKDYAWVMPLTSNKKWGIKYLYQPPFTQQLGIFSKPGSDVPFKNIIQLLLSKFSFWEINLNASFPINNNKLQINTGTNFLLSLNCFYQDIFNNYSKDLIKNLKRSNKFKLTYRTGNYLEAIEAYKNNYATRMEHVTLEDYNCFENVCEVADEQSAIICREAVNEQNELMAIVLLLKDHRRLYNIMNTTTSEGRKVEANHYLVDSVIKEFAGTSLTFDFEGSDLPGVKSFYENFGAVNEPYFIVKYNNLPWPFYLFK
jgi:hypothetical protein